MADTINWSISPANEGASIQGTNENATVTFDTNYKTATTYTVTCTSGTHKGTFIVKRKGNGCSGGGGGGSDLTGHCSVSIQNNTSNDFTITNKAMIYVTNRETQQACYNGVFLYLNGREEDSSTYFLQRNAGLEFTGVFVKSNSTDPVINQDICLLCGERKVKLYQTNGEDIEWTGINHPHIIGTNVKLTDGGSYTIRIDSSCT